MRPSCPALPMRFSAVLPVALGEVEKGAFNPKRVFNLSDGRERPGNAEYEDDRCRSPLIENRN